MQDRERLRAEQRRRQQEMLQRALEQQHGAYIRHRQQQAGQYGTDFQHRLHQQQQSQQQG